VFYMLGVVLWLIYGLRIRAAEVILANIVAGALVSAAIVMKYRSERACHDLLLDGRSSSGSRSAI
jgi:hypothetical protein